MGVREGARAAMGILRTAWGGGRAGGGPTVGADVSVEVAAVLEHLAAEAAAVHALVLPGLVPLEEGGGAGARARGQAAPALRVRLHPLGGGGLHQGLHVWKGAGRGGEGQERTRLG